MKVKLAEGCEVRDPDSLELLPKDEAVTVPDNQFWRRRIRDGDVTLEDDGEKPAAEAQEGASRRRPTTLPPGQARPSGDPLRGP